MPTVHESDFCRLTPRAETIMLLTNAYKYLFPRSSFKEMGEYLGISKDNARRYYYGIHQLNEFRKGTYQRMRKGSNTPYTMSKEYAILVLSRLEDYKDIYRF